MKTPLAPIVSVTDHPLARWLQDLGFQPRLRISLDQNFHWNFHTRKIPAIVRLHDALLRTVASKKVVCPLHINETLFESSLLPDELQQGIRASAESLCGGHAFIYYVVSMGRETLALVRRHRYWSPLVPGTLQLLQGTDLRAMGAENRAAKRHYKEALDRQSYPPASYTPGMTVDDIEASIMLERAGSMYRLVEAIATRGDLETGKPEWEVTQGIARFLIEQGITTNECARLMHAIRHHEWAAIPTLFAHTRLCARLESDGVRGRAAQPNDHFDLSRLAVAVNDADVIFCDQAMASLIQQSKAMNPKRNGRVFALSQADEAIDFLDHL